MKKKNFMFLFIALLTGCSFQITSASTSSNDSIVSSTTQENSNTSISSPNISSIQGTSSIFTSNSSSFTTTSYDPKPIPPAPAEYYKNLNLNKIGLSFRSDLASLITDTHKTYTTYDDLKTVFNTTDVDPKTKSGMLWFYTGTKVSGYSGSSNREHVWPKDGGDAFPEKSGPGSDAHHLRPTDSTLNSSRGSLNFDEVEQTGNNIVKESGSTNYSNPCYRSGSFFYPGVGYRGATARILMYVQTRWGDQYNLKFVDAAGNCKTIGKISTLMKWHLTEPVTEAEIYRNEEVYKIQGNRNPFIDHPEFASKIYCNDGESYNDALKQVVEQYGDYNPAQLKSISLDETNCEMVVGQEKTLKVTTNPANASVNIEWSSEDSTIASVNNGAIKALKNGTTNIVAISKENPSIKATCKVTVKEIKSINVSGTPNKTVYSAGERFDPRGLTVQAVYNDNSTKNIDLNDCKWLDGKTLKETLSEGTTIVICQYGNINKVINGIIVNKSQNKVWKLVTDENELVSGDKIVMANTAQKKIAGQMDGAFLGVENLVITEDYFETLPQNALIFTLNFKDNYWNLKNDNGDCLAAVTTKKVAWNEGDINWEITIEGNNATIQSATANYGRFLYNVSSPRFTTYSSAVSDQMLLPQIFKLS